MKKFFAIAAAAVLAMGLSAGVMAHSDNSNDNANTHDGNSNAHGGNLNKGKGNNSGKSDAAPGHNK